MTPADRCRSLVQACCQLMAPDEPWRVVVTSSERLVLVEVFACEQSIGRLLGRKHAHVEAMRVLVKAAGRGEVRVRCWIYQQSSAGEQA